MPFITTADGTDIFYNDWGIGRPVVLIHGWPLDSDMWEYQAGFLASSGYRVIAYDRRGFGRSSQPWSGYDYDTLADDLKAVLDGLDLHQATLVGFSMGGGEVARYMSRHGGARVAQTVLIGAVVPYLLKTDDNPDGVDQSVFDEIVAGLRKDRPSFLATFAKPLFGAGMLSSPVSTELLQWTLILALRGSAKATLDCVTAFSATDFRTDLLAFHVPTLIIHGDADATVPIDKSAKLAATLIANSEFRAYEGAPHGLFYTERDRLNADLLAFLGRL